MVLLLPFACSGQTGAHIVKVRTNADAKVIAVTPASPANATNQCGSFLDESSGPWRFLRTNRIPFAARQPMSRTDAFFVVPTLVVPAIAKMPAK